MKYKRIALDPGHGGKDPGAVANGLIEKELNFSFIWIWNHCFKFYNNYNFALTASR